jgi:hypothetical protein
MSEHKDNLQSEYTKANSQAQLFTLRIWVTNQDEASLEWRGRLQHIQSGEVQYCKDWESFVSYVEETLRNQPKT